MILKKLYETLPVACHTDFVQEGGTFVAIKGMSFDGISFIPTALERGATTLVIQKDALLTPEVELLIKQKKASIVRVEDTRLALAQLSAIAFKHPAKKLKFIAITGTKGKTTTTFLVEHLLKNAGYKTALLSTVKNRINNVEYATKLTTQQPDYLHAFFDQCVKEGVEWVVMEVAAQAFSLHRVHGITFDAGIFTNFSREHGEFYPSQDEYFSAKAQLLSYLKPGAPLILNQDDTKVAALGEKYKPTFFFTSTHPYTCPQLVGRFNAYNIAAATAAVSALGVKKSSIISALASFPGVAGRLDRIQLPNGATAFIDYAHNPASFQAVLSELRLLTNNLIVLFGAGGDRDPVRRPLMGDIASTIADYIVVTSDNPRSEDPAEIARQILVGIKPEQAHKVMVELDREAAIRKAYAHSKAGSIIALLGKGPDEYQIVKGVTTPFSERSILLALK